MQYWMMLCIFNRRCQFQIAKVSKRIIHLCRKSDFNEIVINIYVKCHLNLKRHVNMSVWIPQDCLKLHFQWNILFSFKSSLISAPMFIVLFENAFSFLFQMFTEQTQNMVNKWEYTAVSINWLCLSLTSCSGKVFRWLKSKILFSHGSYSSQYHILAMQHFT